MEGERERVYQPTRDGDAVNPGNKEMIKSDLMSRRRRRRQAKTHIRHSQTDVPAPPSGSSPLNHSLTHSLAP